MSADQSLTQMLHQPSRKKKKSKRREPPSRPSGTPGEATMLPTSHMGAPVRRSVRLPTGPAFPAMGATDRFEDDEKAGSPCHAGGIPRGNRPRCVAQADPVAREPAPSPQSAVAVVAKIARGNRRAASPSAAPPQRTPGVSPGMTHMVPGYMVLPPPLPLSLPSSLARCMTA